MVFNIKEIFDLAIKMEQTGINYYSEAVKHVEDEEAKKLLTKLADMEDKHKDLFGKMQKQLADDPEFDTKNDPDDESLAYLDTLVRGKVFDAPQDPQKIFKKGVDRNAIIKQAMQLEKDSIVYYFGLASAVPAEYGQTLVKKIIDEEKKHVVLLNDWLNK